MVDLSRRILGFGDERRGSLLGLDEVARTALLGLGEDLRAALLGLGGDAPGLLVGGAQDRGALRAEGSGERCLVKGGIRGAALGFGELILEFTNPALEVTHLAGHGFEVEPDLAGVEAALAQRGEVRSGDITRRTARATNK